MPALGRVIPWLVLGFALLALALGAYEWSHPPFTDEQLRRSLVNTWEVAASTTRVFGIVFIGLGLICLALGRRVTGSARLTAWLAAGACGLTLLVFLRNHVHLTQRAEELTGRVFGPLSGIF